MKSVFSSMRASISFRRIENANTSCAPSADDVAYRAVTSLVVCHQSNVKRTATHFSNARLRTRTRPATDVPSDESTSSSSSTSFSSSFPLPSPRVAFPVRRGIFTTSIASGPRVPVPSDSHSLSVPLVSAVGLPARDTASGFWPARNKRTCSSCASKCTDLPHVGVLGSLLLVPAPAAAEGSVTTVMSPRARARRALSEDLSGSPDFLRTSAASTLRGTDTARVEIMFVFVFVLAFVLMFVFVFVFEVEAGADSPLVFTFSLTFLLAPTPDKGGLGVGISPSPSASRAGHATRSASAFAFAFARNTHGVGVDSSGGRSRCAFGRCAPRCVRWAICMGGSCAPEELDPDPEPDANADVEAEAGGKPCVAGGGVGGSMTSAAGGTGRVDFGLGLDLDGEGNGDGCGGEGEGEAGGEASKDAVVEAGEEAEVAACSDAKMLWSVAAACAAWYEREAVPVDEEDEEDEVRRGMRGSGAPALLACRTKGKGCSVESEGVRPSAELIVSGTGLRKDVMVWWLRVRSYFYKHHDGQRLLMLLLSRTSKRERKLDAVTSQQNGTHGRKATSLALHGRYGTGGSRGQWKGIKIG